MSSVKAEKNKAVPANQPDSAPLGKILAAVCIALMAVIASVSGLNVAQPMLALTFNASQNTVLWMINVYTFTLAALLLPLGAVGDRKGRKKILLAGLILFGSASILSAAATSTTVMLTARFLAGIGAAMIMPVTLAVITSTFPPEKRAKAIGIWTGVAGAGGIAGMYLSALLVDIAHWRWLFVLPVVLSATAVFMTLRFVPDSAEKNTHRFDVWGALLSVTGIIGIVYGLHQWPATGLRDPLVFISLAAGMAGIAGFIVWEWRHNAPLLDVKLFRDKSLSTGSITVLTVFGVQAGIFIVLFPFFQGVLDWSGLRATLAMMPMAVLMMASAGLAPRLALRAGSKNTLVIGTGLSALGAMSMAVCVSAETGYLSVLPGLLMMGSGMGFSMTPSTEAITAALPAHRQGIASALNDITRELGTALGVALLAPLVTAGYQSAIAEKLDGFPAQVIAKAKEGFTHAQMIAAGSGNQEKTLLHAARESFVTGWQHAMWAGAGLMVLLLVYLLLGGTTTAGAGTTTPHKTK